MLATWVKTLYRWIFYYSIHKITKIVRALWLAERRVCMGVCKHGCDIKMFWMFCFFHALITQARIWKRFWVENFDKFTLLSHFLVGWKLETLCKTWCVNFELSWHFKRGKTRILESIFFAKQGLITRTSFVYKTSRLVRISLLISALNKRVLLFFSGKLFYKSNRKLFSCVCISWYKHSRGWENSRQLCEPLTSSLVCLTFSNSPNPSRDYITLCKHVKRFQLLE